MFNLTSPVTGQSQTGLTSPTYPVVKGVAPTPQGSQWIVSGTLGGTQVGVTTHTPSSPFLINFVVPKVWRTLQAVLNSTGLIKTVPVNEVKAIVLKGVTPFPGQPPRPMEIRVTVKTPAGAESNDSANVRAALSFAFGAIAQQSAGIGDTVVTGN